MTTDKKIMAEIKDIDWNRYDTLMVQITDKDGKGHLRPITGISVLTHECKDECCKGLKDILMFELMKL